MTQKTSSTQGLGLDEPTLQRQAEHVVSAHPEQAAIIRAFVPLLIARAQLLRDLPPREIPAQRTLPLTFLEASDELQMESDKDTAYSVALSVLDAVGEGFPTMREDSARIRQVLNPEQNLRLCKAWLANDAQTAAQWAEQHKLPVEMLAFIQGQTCRILLAHAAASLSEAPENVTQRQCPYCQGTPELSVVHGTEGRRSLVCSQCGRVWRYKRTACPACGHEAPENLQSLYVEKHPEERGLWCDACNHYVLEVDIRHLDLAPHQCQVLALALGHLDVLMQHEGKLPLQSSGE